MRVWPVGPVLNGVHSSVPLHRLSVCIESSVAHNIILRLLWALLLLYFDSVRPRSHRSIVWDAACKQPGLWAVGVDVPSPSSHLTPPYTASRSGSPRNKGRLTRSR